MSVGLAILPRFLKILLIKTYNCTVNQLTCREKERLEKNRGSIKILNLLNLKFVLTKNLSLTE